MNEDKNIRISVIILTHNGDRFLDECLSAIFRQRVEVDFEILCVDSESEDKTIEICKKYPVKLYHINKNDFNHGLTRNFAISKARGEFVILISQDAKPCGEYWMSALIKTIEEDSKIAGVYCRQIPRDDADILTKRDLNNHLTARKEKVISFIRDSKEYASLSPMKRYIFCNFDDVCSCIRRGIWKKIPFSKTNFAEDVDWSKRVLESGYKIVYEPLAAVIHSHNGSFLYHYKRSYIGHKKLYELFRVRPVSTYREIILFSLCNILRDICYVIRNENLSTKMLQMLLTLPISSYLKILGQYRGAKKAYENIANNS